MAVENISITQFTDHHILIDERPMNWRATVSKIVRILRSRSRAGTACTKTRGEVSYSTIKVRRQKGSGRARLGGKGSPMLTGGGVAHGPKPKDYANQMKYNKKEHRAAMRFVYIGLQLNKNVHIMNNFDEVLKTSLASTQLDGLRKHPHERLLIVCHTINRAYSNIPNCRQLIYTGLNLYDLMACRRLVITKECLTAIETRVHG
jgi:large subunit ribosomal protein L4